MGGLHFLFCSSGYLLSWYLTSIGFERGLGKTIAFAYCARLKSILVLNSAFLLLLSYSLGLLALVSREQETIEALYIATGPNRKAKIIIFPAAVEISLPSDTNSS